jgi:RecA/RadA recombinase
MQPGMIVEIASPPGGGKSSLIMSVLMSARMNGEGEVTEDEVVVIGMCYRCAVALGGRALMIGGFRL